jgi:Spy/CpxP family protein refolding chaperone
MLRKNLLIGLLFILVCLPATLMAQGMMFGKWWHDNSVCQSLGLTDEETKVLDEKYNASRRSMIDLKSEVERQRFELDLLLNNPDADKQEIRDRFEKLEQARTKLSKERFEMFMAIRDTIGAERFQELKMMRRERGGRNNNRFPQSDSYRERGGFKN